MKTIKKIALVCMTLVSSSVFALAAESTTSPGSMTNAPIDSNGVQATGTTTTTSTTGPVAPVNSTTCTGVDCYSNTNQTSTTTTTTH